MKDEVFHSASMQIFFYPKQKIFEIILMHQFEEVDLFKEDLYLFLGTLSEYKPDKNLWDFRNCQVVFDEQLQQWADENINRRELEEGIRIEAFVVNPTDLITELGLEQVMGEEFGSKIITRMFDNREQAFEWLVNY